VIRLVMSHYMNLVQLPGNICSSLLVTLVAGNVTAAVIIMVISFHPLEFVRYLNAQILNQVT